MNHTKTSIITNIPTDYRLLDFPYINLSNKQNFTLYLFFYIKSNLSPLKFALISKISFIYFLFLQLSLHTNCGWCTDQNARRQDVWCDFRWHRWVAYDRANCRGPWGQFSLDINCRYGWYQCLNVPPMVVINVNTPCVLPGRVYNIYAYYIWILLLLENFIYLISYKDIMQQMPSS